MNASAAWWSWCTSANERTRAPLRLRERIEAQRPSPAKRARRRFGYAGGLAAGLAVVVLALVLLLPGGSPGAPSVSEAAGLASLGATQAAPMPDPSNPIKLGSDVEDVYFPNWEKRFEATATGQRNDTLDGRPATTVFYEMNGKTIAYTIVGRAGAVRIAVEGDLAERHPAVDVRAQRPPDRHLEARRPHLHPVERRRGPGPAAEARRLDRSGNQVERDRPGSDCSLSTSALATR